MPRPSQNRKYLITSYRTTADMKSCLSDAANAVGATEAEITRLAIYETSKRILSSPEVQQALRQRFAV